MSLAAPQRPALIHSLYPGLGRGIFKEILHRVVPAGLAAFLASARVLAATNSVTDTKFSPNRGFFYAPISVTIRCDTPGATLVYTTNGDIPSLTAGTAVRAGDGAAPVAMVPIATTTIVRAAAFKEGLAPTDVDTHTYLFPRAVAGQAIPRGASPLWIDDPPGNGITYPADFAIDAGVVTNTLPGYSFTNALLSLPTLSLASPIDGLLGWTNGIYARAMMEGDAWERVTSAELIYPDGRAGFQADAGLRIHGATSRGNSLISKHSLRLAFRGIYGTGELDFPLYPDSYVHRFDDLILRACSTDAWPMIDSVGYLWSNSQATYQRDQWMRDAQLALGHASAHGIYVHVYLNGVYWGVYNLTERMGESFAATYFGGRKEEYDVISYEFGSNHIATAGNDLRWKQLIQVANLVPSFSAQYWVLQGRNSDGTRNPALPVLLDIDNFIDYMLLHIYAAATDWPNRNWWAVRRRDTAPDQLDSTGFKFLVWDQEVALDRLNRIGTWSMMTPFEEVSQPDTPAEIYDRLRTAGEFRLRFADRLQKHLLNGGALTVAANRARWAGRAAEIDHAIVAESARWGDAHHSPALLRETNWLAVQDFTQNIFWPSNEVAAWQRFRNVALYPGTLAPVFSQYGGGVAAGYELVMTRPGPEGAIFYTVNGGDPRKPGGAVAADAMAYERPVPIQSTSIIRARVKDSWGWSALVAAVFHPPQDLGSLALTEIMYNPPDGTSFYAADAEFIELKNTGTNAINLSGMAIPAIGYTFPAPTVIAAGAFHVLVRSSDQGRFAARHPGVAVASFYTGALDNGGETLALVDTAGHPVFSVAYDDEVPWPAAADGLGFSLVPRAGGATPAPDDGSKWRASSRPGGSPGADDPEPATPGIVINEVLTASVPPEVDRIELFNPTAADADIGGWLLSDDRSLPGKYRIPTNTVVRAGGFAVFDEAQFNPTPGMGGSFALNSGGDDLYFFSADLAGHLTGYSQGVKFGAADAGVPFGRYVDSVSGEHWPAQAAQTFGADNAGPRVGPIVITEINYHPAVGGDEFVELKNITMQAVPLFDALAPTNTWRFSGLGFTFPLNVIVPAGAFVVIAPTNPAAFAASHSVPTNALVLGPFSGQLQDSGELLALERRSVADTGWVVVDEVRYNDKAPWPAEADGGGASLQRRDPAAYGNDPANWMAAAPTPGQAGVVPSPLPVDPGIYCIALMDAVSTTNGVCVSVRFPTLKGATYSVLCSDQAAGGQWRMVENVTGDELTRLAIVRDTLPAGLRCRFYRVVSPAQ